MPLLQLLAGCLPACHLPTAFPLQEDFKPMVRRSSGFEWRPERPNATTFVEQKWGWTGQAVGEPASSSTLGFWAA